VAARNGASSAGLARFHSLSLLPSTSTPARRVLTLASLTLGGLATALLVAVGVVTVIEWVV
jgi:hypothetical protein